MKKYTVDDMRSFQKDVIGRLICPSGDYTEIKRFGAWCSFGDGCKFGDGCSFGNGGRFGNGCRFGIGCRFGNGCRFGIGCSFGDGCSFENGQVKNGRYVTIGPIGSKDRRAYFFIDEYGDMYVRAGCWFSMLDEFKERVRAVHGGTKNEKHYLAVCDLAEMMLKEE